jgi:Xaa-Pro dipeptidase
MTVTNRTALRASAREGRLGRLCEAMDAAGIDGALVYGSGNHNLGRPNPCWYFSGTKQLGPEACLVVVPDREIVLVTTPMWDAERSRAESWIDDVIATDALPDALDDLLDTRGLRSLRWGLLGFGRSAPEVAAAVRRSTGDRAVEFEVFEELARVHDELSLALIGRSVEIAEAGYACILAATCPGITEYELAAEVEFTMRSLGADDNFQFVIASQQHLAPRPSLEREVHPGDIVLAELSPSVDGQFAQICRSAVVGGATKEAEACYGILQEALEAGLSTCRPGAEVGHVAAAVNDVIAGYGYGEYNRPPYMRNRGHGVGLSSANPRGITPQSTDVLEVGMSFVLHPNQYFPDAGYLLCGDQVVIEPAGARVLAAGRPQLAVIQ